VPSSDERKLAVVPGSTALLRVLTRTIVLPSIAGSMRRDRDGNYNCELNQLLTHE